MINQITNPLNLNQQMEIKLTKTELAKRLGVSRSSLYYKRVREQTDEEV